MSQPVQKVTDVALAGFLQTQGAKLIGIEDTESWRQAIVFEDSPEIESLKMDFFRNAVVPARDYFNALRNIRGMLAQHQRELEKEKSQ